MAIESIDIPLGTPIPAFALPDPFGKEHQSKDLMGKKGILVIFTCNHCPYARAVWPRTIRLAEEFRPKGISTVAINPNINPSYPDDAPDVMKEKITEWGISFPYLVDATQEVARQYKAQCTPDLYLFRNDGGLVYHGRVDNNWQDESKVSKHELRMAMQHLVNGEPIDVPQLPSIGCSIKWRSS